MWVSVVLRRTADVDTLVATSLVETFLIDSALHLPLSTLVHVYTATHDATYNTRTARLSQCSIIKREYELSATIDCSNFCTKLTENELTPKCSHLTLRFCQHTTMQNQKTTLFYHMNAEIFA